MLTIALPKGRLLDDVAGLLKRMGIATGSMSWGRMLSYLTRDKRHRFLILRARDVATYVEYGGADIGITGEDILREEERDIYEPLDLRFGYCRIVVAELEAKRGGLCKKSFVRIATKYPNITERHFSKKGIQVEIIKLYGSIELAPVVCMADGIVDLVSTGRTLRENGLIEVETIMESTAKAIVNRASMKTKYKEISGFLQSVRKSLQAI